MTRRTTVEIDASSTENSTWDTIDWSQVEANVHRLQMRIAKAYLSGMLGYSNSSPGLSSSVVHRKGHAAFLEESVSAMRLTYSTWLYKGDNLSKLEKALAWYADNKPKESLDQFLNKINQ